jgi:6-pyruvoyltetrahydropterin/6-carboxytetrahydropterin synthase
VVDIGRATDTLNKVLAGMSYRNLDEEPTFKGRNTTTEFLARAVFDRLVEAIRGGDLGPPAGGIESVRVTLHESHLAAAAFDGRV